VHAHREILSCPLGVCKVGLIFYFKIIRAHSLHKNGSILTANACEEWKSSGEHREIYNVIINIQGYSLATHSDNDSVSDFSFFGWRREGARERERKANGKTLSKPLFARLWDLNAFL
jgi:hypothetical protein